MGSNKKDSSAVNQALRLTSSLLIDPQPTVDCDLLVELMDNLRTALAAAEAAYAEHCLIAKPTPTDETE